MTSRRFPILLACLTVAAVPTARAADPPKPVKVFVLAGQSNMEGQAVADLGGKDYNDGKGTLKALLNDPAKAPLVQHLRTEKGTWAVRDDVWVRYRREKQPLMAGPLTVGFAVYGGTHHFGPELQFGHVVGNHFAEQVLLVKTAWGGKSLYRDFRPRSSGGTVGPYYTRMIGEVREAVANLAKDFPAYAGQGYELAGFVWYHGWNDGVNPKHAVPEYEQNLVNLIKDVRKDLKAPSLPVVIGELTGPWADAPGEWATLRKAQAAAAARPEFRGTVRFVPTRDFVRPAKESPNPTHGHHEFGNAETYVLVGDALGKGMVRLLPPPPVKKPFTVDGRPAFVIMPARVEEKRPVPWVWYAPTFPNLPEAREHWMFERFLTAGIAIAGVDVGESYGSPTGRATYSALYKELVTGRNFANKPVLLARSRGGLMLYNWAAENPDFVGGIAGIYPVCDLRSYPGLDKACGAYGLTRAELEGQLDHHNPVARLAPLAKAGVPIFHIHGDTDAVVPLGANSEEVRRRYEKLGGTMELKVATGQGHNYWDGFFRCQELVDFVLARAAPARAPK
ncbi:MAG TPA: sialate O-acetylesterase [Gemmataceae bacterium]|nr:sialate O-acetylesterase [Gemmataceae bacterium]